MAHPKVFIAKVANVFTRQMHFEKTGDLEQGHCHAFDHVTLLASGSLKVTVEGVVSEFKAPHIIFIHKDKMHELVSLEDNTVAYCIHGLREKDTDDIITPSMIPLGVEISNKL